MTLTGRLCTTVAGGLIVTACSTTPPVVRQQCYDAGAQLANVLAPLEALQAKGCREGNDRRGGGDCERLRRELERLTVICPGYAPALLANAVIAYDEHRPASAQQFLDQILSQAKSYPDAVVLRARIAMEDGNLAYARRLLDQQIHLVPDHAGLHETYGAALYLGGQLSEARGELTTAGALGAPRWRIAYHLGLIEEALARLEQAIALYAEAVAANPGWAPAESRLKALRARDSTQR